jgi:hypothetical protein
MDFTLQIEIHDNAPLFVVGIANTGYFPRLHSPLFHYLLILCNLQIFIEPLSFELRINGLAKVLLIERPLAGRYYSCRNG